MRGKMLFTIGLIIFIGMLSQWISWKFKIPVIITLLVSGVVAGPIFGLLEPQKYMDQQTIFSIVELSVALILFDGAMQLKFSDFKAVSSGLKRILTLGVLIHFVLITGAAHLVMGVSWGFSALLGGILIVTGPTVIIPALREVNLNKKVSNYLKWEGILTDPVGAIIAVVVYDAMVLSNETDASHVFMAIMNILLVAFGISFALKLLLNFSLRKMLIPEFLQIPFITSLVVCSFVFSNEIQHGSGLLTVTLLGILIGNSKIDILFQIRTFKENITTMSVSFVFIIITSSISFDAFKMIGLPHIIFILLVAFVLRIVSIMISTFKTPMSMKEKILIGSYGPRGVVAVSVAAALSTEMINDGNKMGELFLPIVLLVIFTTVVTHGMILKPLSQKLNLKGNERNGVIFIGTMPWVVDLAVKLKKLGLPVMVTSASWYKLAPFRTNGIKTFYGQLLDHLEYESIDLNEYSSLIAMSENDSYNILACEKFSKYLGHNNVYHLKRSRNFIHDQYNIDKSSYCVLLNNLELRYENLMKYYQYGWTFKDTLITDNYLYQDFLLDNENGIVCLVISKNGQVQFGAVHGENPKKGDILVSFSPKEKYARRKGDKLNEAA